jgi:hypothetical protein
MKAKTCGNCFHGCKLLGRGQIQCKNPKSKNYLRDVRHGWEVIACFTDPKDAKKEAKAAEVKRA